MVVGAAAAMQFVLRGTSPLEGDEIVHVLIASCFLIFQKLLKIIARKNVAVGSLLLYYYQRTGN